MFEIKFRTELFQKSFYTIYINITLWFMVFNDEKIDLINGKILIKNASISYQANS